MGEDIRQMFDKAIKSKKLNEFYEYLSKNNLEKEFIIRNCFREEDENISFMALKLGMEILKESYGDDLANRFGNIIYNDSSKMRNFHLFYLMSSLPKSPVSEKEAIEIEKILEIASQEDYIIGTHIIGSEIGEKVQKQGIWLTGHKFAGKDEDKSIELKIAKNITLFKKNDSISTLLQMVNSRKYNDRGDRFNDIVMVLLPKKELEQNNKNIVLKDEQGREYLNPKYNAGYVRIDKESGNIEGLHESPYSTLQKTEQVESKEWEEKLNQWYQSYSKKPNVIKVRFEEITQKIKNIFIKTKQLPSPSDEDPKNNTFKVREDTLDGIKCQIDIDEQKKFQLDNERNDNDKDKGYTLDEI